MSRFGDLLGGKVTPPTPVVVTEPTPDVVKGDSDKGKTDLDSLSKIELDRRFNKKKLIKQIEDELKKQ